MRSLVSQVCLPVLALVTLASTYPGNAAEITLAVANSTCGTVQAVGARYVETHDIKINYLCKSSGLLAKGIRGGAIQADIYISASQRWMEYMVKGGLVAADKVVSPWGNRLVVGAPAGSPLKLEAWNDLTTDKVKTILIGDPGTAPFGRYAKQALQRTGIWEQIKQKITTTRHITLLADRLAQSDNRTVGILFSTNLSDRLRSIYPVDPTWHPEIRYYMAPLGAPEAGTEASRFFEFINGDPGREAFQSAGFDVSG
ncbi:molybdate ABC transporter substrate-binding protein [Sedimenticola hydrogenitrophicus]|uniref:molybdate ABC transporter substrate-binding protein n=1 Tax=Sedimenticola hydrogenitrophicus TaxID=2967975 RepID=UPI0023B00785|nr:molybdate ABC transporter substrate-binding protein [Sedimenticola hydrogenitrophicus]